MFHVSWNIKARASLRLDIEVCLEQNWRKSKILLCLVNNQCRTAQFHVMYGTAIEHGGHGGYNLFMESATEETFGRSESAYDLGA